MMQIDRRQFLHTAAILGGAALAGTAMAGCKSGGGALSCSDTAGLAPADLATRTSNAYIDATTDPAKRCDGCALYTAGAAGACGGCTVVKGPINPAGYCNIWVAKA